MAASGVVPSNRPGDGTVAILGAGSLGRLWAGYLPAGTALFVPRTDSPDQSRYPVSYQLRCPDDTERPVTVAWFDPACQLPDLLLVTTKAQDTLAALETVMPMLPEHTPVVLFQNGMGSQQAVAARWPDRPVLAASTTEGANRPAADITVHAGRGQTWLGALTASANPVITKVTETLASTGLEVIPTAAILQRLWDKLIINAGINPFTALLDCPNGDLLTAPLFLEHIDALCREISQLLEAEKLPTASPQALRQRIEQVATATASNTSSMRADVQHGRATEIDYINGFMVSRGARLGLPMPVNQMLTEQVKQLSTNYGR